MSLNSQSLKGDKAPELRKLEGGVRAADRTANARPGTLDDFGQAIRPLLPCYRSLVQLLSKDCQVKKTERG